MGYRVDLDATSGYTKFYPCPPGGRGYTFWKDNNLRTMAPGDSIVYTFTCDRPTGYYISKDNCEFMLEKIHTSSGSSADDVPVRISIKSALTGGVFREINTEHHSKTAAHDFWLGLDLGNDPYYDDSGYNEMKVENLGNVSVTIYSCFIFRIYISTDCPPCAENEPETETVRPQETPDVVASQVTVNMDPSRVPWPCIHGQGGRGYSFWKEDALRTIAPGDYLEYKLTCDRPSNYVAKDACLALLEKIQINSDATTNDVPIRIKVNGVEMHVEYHSKKQNHDIWIGVNLANMSSWNDVGQNILRIENLDGSKSVSLLSCYIYRVYMCQPKP